MRGPREFQGLAAKAASLLMLAGALGCSQSVLVRTDREDAYLVMGGQDEGAVDDEGIYVDVPLGFEPVPWELRDEEGRVLEAGAAEREVRWVPLITGIALAAVCVPTCVSLSLFVANPLLLVAPLYLVGGTCAGFGTILSAPGWLTLPCAFGATVCGLSPLSLLAFAERLPGTLWIAVDPAKAEERERRQKERKERRRRPRSRRDAAAPAPTVAMRF